ncbi:MAG: PEP/pyruvate-binding domain-containing protein, partial [Ardenticatenaceae bacterium]
MSEKPILLWLDDPRATDATLVGPKAARLAMMRQAGMPVPAAFVLTTHLFSAGMSDASKDVLRTAYNRLLSTPSPSLPFSASPPLDFASPTQPLPVAVRSSATAEDLDGASFAGMQDTVLNVISQEQMLAAVRRVWESLESPEARAYRERAGVPASAMAVLVQQQVAATVAGVAFACDPITGEDVMVIEAVAGLGEALVSGKTEPQRWQIPRHDGSGGWETSQIVTTAQAPLLREADVSKVVTLVAQACDFFGEPQDVEWAWDEERLWMLQSRPITTSPEDWFTDHLPNDDYLWTAAFLNERFTQPVSPLGWSMIAKPLARLALRGPLELLGGQKMEGPLLKLWRGHPYSRVEAWQRIYKLFPDAILPEDAERYFPEGDTSLRSAPRHPTFGVHLFLNGLGVLKQNFGATSPLHNPQAWARYEKRQVAALIRFRFAERQLARYGSHQAPTESPQAPTESPQAPTESPQAPTPIPAARRLLQEVADLTDELLNLHRWSLLYADL